MDAPRFETPEETNGDSDTTKHIVLRTIEAIRQIHGTLNIYNRRHHMIFKETLEKWAKVLSPAYSLQEMQDCLLDICNNIIEDYNKFPIIITNAISITSIIIGFMQNKLKEEWKSKKIFARL